MSVEEKRGERQPFAVRRAWTCAYCGSYNAPESHACPTCHQPDAAMMTNAEYAKLLRLDVAPSPPPVAAAPRTAPADAVVNPTDVADIRVAAPIWTAGPDDMRDAGERRLRLSSVLEGASLSPFCYRLDPIAGLCGGVRSFDGTCGACEHRLQQRRGV
jgi:hypothetical protein